MGAHEPPRRLQERPRALRLSTVVRVLPDVRAIEKTFDYVVPDRLRDHVRVGSLVRIDLNGRRVGGWVVAVDVVPPAGVELKPIARFSSAGPSREILDLADWAAWRWAGRPQHFLTTASPPTVVPGLAPPRARRRWVGSPVGPTSVAGGVLAAIERGDRLVVARVAPAGSVDAVLAAVATLGPIIVALPSIAAARAVANALEQSGLAVARYPRQWAVAASGAADVVVGSRVAVWATIPDLAAIVLVDEHDEAHQSESSPTWNAREVAVERARRAGAACILTSPCPSLEALDLDDAVVAGPSRSDERAGWPIVELVDRGDEDPRTRTSLVSSALARALASGQRVVCVHNTKGVARLMACASCQSIARCEACDAAVSQHDAVLVCARCGATRPVVCLVCGASRMKAMRPGVSRLRGELEAAVGEPVVEVTAATAGAPLPPARVYIGTEAALHQVREADVVAFLDIDAELLAPRFRAGEQVMALLARAARLVGGRAGDGGSTGRRVLVQTSLPDHPVLQAALLADPSRVVDAEREAREALRLPPVTALAAVSGAGSEELVAALGLLVGVEVQGPSDARWLVRARDHAVLCDALETVGRPADRVRIEVDPRRV